MATKIIQQQRIQFLNDHDRQDGDYVLYWMEASQRAQCNHALEYAIDQANSRSQPLLVVFALTDQYPEANGRHYRFMLEGIQQTQQAIGDRGITMIVRLGDPIKVVCDLAKDASLVVCDRGYLRHQKKWRRGVADNVDCKVIQIESDVVVPLETASDKREYAARTIRSKLQSHHDDFLIELATTPLQSSSQVQLSGEDLSDINSAIKKLDVDCSVAAVSDHFRGGTSQARAALRSFVDDHLKHYDQNRNKPETSDTSRLSMYLHFGQISPLTIAMEIGGSNHGGKDDRDAYLEELLIRRELSQNFVHFTDDYDSYSCLPDWAQETLRDHRDDPREHHYTRQQLEDAQTHDPYWNAAMNQMRHTGFMHNHMRMYWGKKIVQWTNTPEYAYRVALELNNRYFLDGRDANSFANVAWLLGNHDRAFTERDVLGKVRYLSTGGLQRKADPDAYADKVEKLVN